MNVNTARPHFYSQDECWKIYYSTSDDWTLSLDHHLAFVHYTVAAGTASIAAVQEIAETWFKSLEPYRLLAKAVIGILDEAGAGDIKKQYQRDLEQWFRELLPTLDHEPD